MQRALSLSSPEAEAAERAREVPARVAGPRVEHYPTAAPWQAAAKAESVAVRRATAGSSFDRRAASAEAKALRRRACSQAAVPCRETSSRRRNLAEALPAAASHRSAVRRTREAADMPAVDRTWVPEAEADSFARDTRRPEHSRRRAADSSARRELAELPIAVRPAASARREPVADTNPPAVEGTAAADSRVADNRAAVGTAAEAAYLPEAAVDRRAAADDCRRRRGPIVVPTCDPLLRCRRIDRLAASR